ncbi:potassium transporter TrkG [Streptomyces sp. DHE17-7]|uniref:potassium transporter TrkG n=1 Tax=Streptomyces sp. DHE17-7 TaxID=2759949 RepID=UPI0022EA9E3D|nr:potassium transporter TrkG [Streptomyces sp. DHE17-7]
MVLLVSHRIGLKARLTAAAETKTLGLGDVRSVVTGVVKVSLLLEALTALVLSLRFATAYDEPWPRSVWLGVFHAVSAFNNAGFALYSDSLMGFATDPWICLPIALAVIAGGLGFPVLFELRRRWSAFLVPSPICVGSGLFLVGGSAFVTAIEWSNPGTLGPMDVPGKLLAGFFQGVMPRTAGFNSIDTSQMNPASWLGTESDVRRRVCVPVAGTAARADPGTADEVFKSPLFRRLFFACTPGTAKHLCFARSARSTSSTLPQLAATGYSSVRQR